ncbi:MAG: peptidoglycan DD-metalloendopeptidase family protein [Gammaproteobacteria bacterium]|nr:peptidoglycan DD-metalloendopeptidase family protein [Gammaproteobacteria bacterium]
MALIVCGAASLLGLAPPTRGTAGDRIVVPLPLPEPGRPVAPSAAPRIVPAPAAPASPTSSTDSLPEPAPKASGGTSRSVDVRQGDSLYSLFRKLGLDLAEMISLVESKPDGGRLKKLLPGQTLKFELDADGNVEALTYRLSRTRYVRYRKNEAGFVSEFFEVPLERRIAHAWGRVQSSLFVAGQRAGLSDRLIMEMAEIFGWDIDFSLDIRTGDEFLLLYEELFEDGEKVGDGNILAAEFINQKKSFRAVRYQDPEGRVAYFSPDGLSMRKAFLRSPVKFGRVSSRFNLRRKHPILHKIRAHRGVDYAAPRGTPVRASGDGKVVFVGRKGGYGRTVVLRHGSAYTTLYAHLNGYAKGIRSGRRVTQGQVIGYIGSTGLATGPHLHYEFRVRGVHRNPLTVKLPKAAPVSPEHKQDFIHKTGKLVSQLDVLSKVRLASRN